MAPLSVRLQTPYMGASSERTPPNAIIEMLERTPAASPPSPFSSLAVSQAPVPTPLREAQLRWSSAVNQWKVLSKSQEKHREDLSEVASVMTEATAAAESIWSKDENSLGDFDGDEGKTYLYIMTMFVSNLTCPWSTTPRRLESWPQGVALAIFEVEI